MSETTTPVAGQPEATPDFKIKTRKPRQRACDEKDEKGNVCCGHLKRWYDYPPEVAARVAQLCALKDGKNAELYRCENCKTLYRPNPGEMPRSYTQRY